MGGAARPAAPAEHAAAEEIDRLYAAMRSVLADATARLRTLVPPDIQTQHREFLKVHLRGGEPCPRCGRTLRQIGGDEATTFCRACQPPVLRRARRVRG